MSIESRMMAYSYGGEKLVIINRARLKAHSIGTRLFWGGSFEQAVKGISKWKQLSDVISSTDSSKMDDINQSLLLDI